MAGYQRPTCQYCGKLYKFEWVTETFIPRCSCKTNVDESNASEEVGDDTINNG